MSKFSRDEILSDESDSDSSFGMQDAQGGGGYDFVDREVEGAQDEYISTDDFDQLNVLADGDNVKLDATSAFPSEFESEVIKSFEESIAAKELGNIHFRNKDYDSAIEQYAKAIRFCPDDSDVGIENLSIYFGNRSAAYYAVSEYDLAIEDCTESLSRNSNYVKVLHRRSLCYEKLEKYDEELADLQRIAAIDPSFPKITENIKRIEALNAEKMNKLKDEALGKLKELGNSILGNFGMSLDNFKMTQDPNSGSWSIGMNK